MAGRRIGIVEDDEALCRELQVFLHSNGYQAEIVPSQKYQAEAIIREGYHLLLLDIGLPDVDGQYLCKQIRKVSELPVVMITSRNTELTELMSITCGADDFIAKPFNPQILLARIEGIMKRVYRESSGDMVINLGRFTLDVAMGRIISETGSEELTKNELKIMSALASRQGEIITRDEIMNLLWDDKMFVDDNTLTVNMTRLKGKLEQIGIRGAINTKRGMGYQLL